MSTVYTSEPGHGTTRVPKGAVYRKGDTMRLLVGKCPRQVRVVAVVPPGVSPDVAVADQWGQERPHLLRTNRRRKVSYVVHVEGQKSGLWVSEEWIAERRLSDEGTASA